MSNMVFVLTELTDIIKCSSILKMYYIVIVNYRAIAKFKSKVDEISGR